MELMGGGAFAALIVVIVWRRKRAGRTVVDDKPLRTSNEEVSGAKPKPAKGSRRKKGYSKTPESCDADGSEEEDDQETEEAVKVDAVEVVVARSGDGDLD